jgi:hypothetical protein
MRHAFVGSPAPGARWWAIRGPLGSRMLAAARRAAATRSGIPPDQ